MSETIETIEKQKTPKPPRPPKGKELGKPLWRAYTVTWEFPGNVCGNVPKAKELIDDWLNARKPTVRPAGSKSIVELQSEVAETLANPLEEDEEERAWNGFQAHLGHLAMHYRTIRGHFKDCGRQVGSAYVPYVKGSGQSFQQRVINGLYPLQVWIPLTRPDGSLISVPDGFTEKPIHPRGPQGPRSALKRFDFVTNVRMQFTLAIWCALDFEDLEILMQYGSIHGYAGERSEGEGRYIFTIEDAGLTTREILAKHAQIQRELRGGDVG